MGARAVHKRSMLWAGAGVLLLAAPGVSAEIGRLAGPFPRAGESSPVAVSTRYVLEGVDLAKGVGLPLTGGTVHLAVLSHDRGVGDLYFLDARGEKLLPGRGPVGEAQRFLEPDLESFDLPAFGVGIRLETPAAGLFTLKSADHAGPVAVVVNEEGSAVEMRVQATPLAARAGEPVTVEARLLALGRPVVGAQVAARLQEWERARAPIVLAEVEPGRYRATITARAAQADGGLLPLSIRVDARGSLVDGLPFARTALTAAMVAAGAADVDLDGVGIGAETLSVPVLGAPGEYRLEAVFGARLDGAGEEDLTSLAYSREDFHLTADGAAVSLPIPDAAAGAERLTLRLLNRATLAVEREVELPLAIEGTAAPASTASPRLPASKAAARARFGDEPGAGDEP
jgi:hypothetical protein